ncbi:hypothetical protein D9Q98_008857 [Chlorella vulgaris]|uniref:DNA-(apurinic or apyrimidinic site) endonuclease n=1 Tax=Chlorella vulgaris TaxID=3077 RepID=A0A9D4TIT5_CHLVU|nr:hypothetical protein D9Q98_008857 [Chlorella vulgaris]
MLTSWLRAAGTRTLLGHLVRRSHPLPMAPKRKAAAALSEAAVVNEDSKAAAPQHGKAKATAAAAAAKSKAAPAKRVAKAKPPPGPAWDASMRPQPLAAGTPACRILSWNVAGLRALLKKSKETDEGTRDELILTPVALAQKEQADVLCLQEIKLQQDHCADVLKDLDVPEGWHVSWNCSRDKKGYSGTAIISRQAPLSVSCGIGAEEHDGEGRVLTAEFPTFWLVNCYVPNSGAGLKRLEYRVNSWDKDFSAYLKRLEGSKPVVLTGDLNVAPAEIDIHSPKTNLKSAGFTPEERASFADNLIGQGFVDCFRTQYPEAVGYTYWGYRFNARANNKGWRLDHFLVSQQLHPSVHECYHLPAVLGSDHCPLGLVVKL